MRALRALVKSGAWIGKVCCIFYIFMYLLGGEATAELFIIFFIFSFILSIIFLFTAPKSEKGKAVKFLVKLFASCFVLFGFMFITIGLYPALGSTFAKGMTKEKILSLKLGMSQDEVITILGKPVKISTFKSLENKNDTVCKLYYVTPGIYGSWFEFSITLTNDKLDYIHIERDDYGVYICHERGCKVYNHESLEELVAYSSKCNILGWHFPKFWQDSQ